MTTIFPGWQPFSGASPAFHLTPLWELRSKLRHRSGPTKTRRQKMGCFFGSFFPVDLLQSLIILEVEIWLPHFRYLVQTEGNGIFRPNRFGDISTGGGLMGDEFLPWDRDYFIVKKSPTPNNKSHEIVWSKPWNCFPKSHGPVDGFSMIILPSSCLEVYLLPKVGSYPSSSNQLGQLFRERSTTWMVMLGCFMFASTDLLKFDGWSSKPMMNPMDMKG